MAWLNGHSDGEIAKSLRAMIKTHKLDTKAAAPVEAAATYLTDNTRLMHTTAHSPRACRSPLA